MMYIAEKYNQKTFSKIIYVLDNNKISWWIDQGSLLGIIRDKCFMPWDHDIDISAWNIEKVDKIKLLKLFLKEFAASYYDPLNDTIKIILYDKEKKEKWWYDISFYNKENNEATKYWEYAQEKKIICKTLVFLATSFFLKNKTPSASKVAKIILILLLPLIDLSSKLHLNSKLGFILFNFIDKFFAKYVLVKTPISFFNSIIKIDYKSLLINVPSESEKYLKFKYGNNWKIPNKKWNYLKEDGSIS